MSIDRFIEFFKEEFESEVTESVSVSPDDSKTIDIFGVIETSPMEILSDDPSALLEAKLKWINEFFEEAKSYIENINPIWQNESRFKEVQREVKAGNLTPFIGSGMSAESGFLTWTKFLKSLQRFGSVSDEDFERLVSERKYDELATVLCETMDETINAEIMHSSFNITLEESKMRLGGAVRLLPNIFKDLVITTNYDNVIEACYSNFGIYFDKLTGLRIEDYQTASMGHARILLKLHGDAFNLRSRVLTKSEYDIAYLPGSNYTKVLEDIYAIHQILFLGCSLDGDRTLEVFQNAYGTGRIYRKHYAFLPVGLDSSEEEEINKHVKPKDNYLRSLGIYPVWYTGKHEDALLNLIVALLAEVGIE